MRSQTKTATQGLTNGTGYTWIAPECASYTDGVNFSSCRVAAPTSLTANLIGYAFGFKIPKNATILGVQCSFQRLIAVSSQDNPIQGGPVVYTVLFQLFRGPFIGTPFNPINQWSTTVAADSCGGPTYLWGGGLTPSLINESGFGFGIAARSDVDPAVLNAQNFQMTVTYE